jgi:16S rRNA (uracil1498-N3)-methyltransferase
LQLYFANDIEQSPVKLDREESHHLMHVLRHRKGDRIYITDGKGKMAVAEITFPDAKECVAEVVEYTDQYPKHPYHLHMAVAPTKNIDRFEWFLEKATEMGIDEITPVLTRRSERKNINEERLTKLIVSAAKQSLKSSFPVLHKLTTYAEVIDSVKAEQKFIAVCKEDVPLLKSSYSPRRSVFILIGPEGDFDEIEITMAVQNGFHGISLGKTRFRTETAALIACNTIALINQ